MRFGALRETRAMRPPHTVLPKTLDLSRPPPQSLRVKIHGSKSSDKNPRLIGGLTTCRVRQKRVFLRERGFASVHLAANAASTGAALTSNAAQVAGLGRICLNFLAHGFSRVSRIEQIHIMNARERIQFLALDYSLFILLYS